MEWTVQAFAWNNATTKRELRAARGRKLSLKLRSPSTLSFTMLGAHPQASLITELVTDVLVTCKPDPKWALAPQDVLRARCGTTQDTVEETGHSVQFSFSDYRGVLQRRFLKADNTLVWNNNEQSDIVWQMIEPVNGIQKRTNGNYGITRGVGAVTGINRQWVPKLGSSVGKEIQSISEMANGFDWDVSPALVLNVYYPSRGLNNGVGIEYGKSVSKFTRNKSPSGFANDLLVTGGTSVSPVAIASATVATDAMGRWDAVISHPGVTEPTTLSSKATFDIAATAALTPQYTVRLAPDFWRGPAHIGLGDTVRLLVVKNRINDNLLLRVLEINVDIGNDGGEDVGLVLGA